MKLRKILKNKTKESISTFAAFVASVGMRTYAAGNFSGSKIATGTQQLVSDASSWLLVIAPSVGTMLIIYYLIRKGMSDEMEHKKWNSRIVVTIISCIGAVVASVLISVLTGYYN